MTANQTKKYLPRLIAWEVTRSCPLNCRHCRAAAINEPYPGELTTDQCLGLLDNINGFSKPIIILTGGEPMLREDIYDIAKYGTDIGLRMVMAPCGELVTEQAARKMLDSGIKRISLSIDGPDAESHDGFRGVDGAFDNVLKAAEAARSTGLEFQINTTVSSYNLGQLERILKLAVDLGAAAFHPFLLVPTGRGKELAHLELSPEEYEKTLNWIYDASLESPIQFKPTCAPHYHRIMRQRGSGRQHSASRSTGHPGGLDTLSRGCMGGTSFAFISHVGKVQICGFLDEEAGDLKSNGFDFEKIWFNSPLFNRMRNREEYNGRCGVCEFHNICGGCRARAFAMTGDYMAEEPFCTYTPRALQREDDGH